MATKEPNGTEAAPQRPPIQKRLLPYALFRNISRLRLLLLVDCSSLLLHCRCRSRICYYRCYGLDLYALPARFRHHSGEIPARAIFSLVLALIFIWSPSLSIIKENKFLLLIFIVFTAIAPLAGLQSSGVFVGFRKTEYSFMQTIVTLARIGIVPFLVAFGVLGIYASYRLTPVLALDLLFFNLKRVDRC